MFKVYLSQVKFLQLNEWCEYAAGVDRCNNNGAIINIYDDEERREGREGGRERIVRERMDQSSPLAHYSELHLTPRKPFHFPECVWRFWTVQQPTSSHHGSISDHVIIIDFVAFFIFLFPLSLSLSLLLSVHVNMSKFYI